MWPFDKILIKRIRDLERSLEIMTGANEVLSRELDRAQTNEADLLDKIFTITGVNRVTPPRPTEGPQDKVRIGGRSTSWPHLRENLETKAREEYWEKKKTQVESTPEEKAKLDKLEKEALG